MPYIDTQARERIDSGGKPENVGELTYVIYKAMGDYGNYGPGTYAHLAETKAAADNAAAEWYRRVIGPYEDSKIKENGDV